MHGSSFTHQGQVAAFQELFGLQSLPKDGKGAKKASCQLGQVLLASVAPPPLLSRLVGEHLAGALLPRPRFVDVSTGLRLRYLEWGRGDDVVLLLHDLGEAADIWAPVASRLAGRGYRVLAPDLRGHGGSDWSCEGRYSADMMAEDVKAFILALDLYVAPLALVGAGIGAAVGLALTQLNPFLAGALVVAEFAVPAAAAHLAQQAQQAHATAAEAAAVPPTLPSTAGADGAASSTVVAPWWGFRAGQAASFASMQQAAAFLAHPLASLAPALLEPLARTVQCTLQASRLSQEPHTDTTGPTSSTAGNTTNLSGQHALSDIYHEDLAQLPQLLADAHRPLQGAVASACCMLQLPSGMQRTMQLGGGGGIGHWEDSGADFPAEGGLTPRMDPAMLFSFNSAGLLSSLSSLRCHLLVLRGGGPGSWVAAAEAETMAQLAMDGGAASAVVAEVPCAGRWLAADRPQELLQQVVGFLEGPAIRCFDRRSLLAAGLGSTSPCPPNNTGGTRAPLAGSGAAAGANGAAACCRRPELLGLRPLPQYPSVEEAKKALGPRSIPSAAALQAELRRLRVEEGRAPDDASSDEEEGGMAAAKGRRQTALAKDPLDYFGFVG